MEKLDIEEKIIRIAEEPYRLLIDRTGIWSEPNARLLRRKEPFGALRLLRAGCDAARGSPGSPSASSGQALAGQKTLARDENHFWQLRQ
jgi:hypothetical protein